MTHQHRRHPRATPTSAARSSAAWRWSTASLLLVDASEGPLPQTRFVLRKALQKRLPVVLVINKVDRPDARIAEVVDETYELFLDLDADERPDRVPDRLLPPRRPAGPSLNRPGDGDDARQREPRAAVRHAARARSRRRRTTEGAPLQAHVTNLDASPYLGRLALCRVHRGHDPQGPAGRLVPAGRHRRAGQDHRAADDRGAGPGAGRVGRPRRHHRRSPASPTSPSARPWPTRTNPVAAAARSPSTSRRSR